MSFPILLSLQLDSIEHFLKQTLRDIDAEIIRIMSAWDETQAQNEDGSDFANLMWRPFMREQITLRATYYELNALIDHSLQTFAQEAYSKSPTHPKKLKFVSDLKRPCINSLLEKYYNISLGNLSYSQTVTQIREIGNSFKHRNGFKDFRKDSETRLSEKHEINRDKTIEAIIATRQYLLDLHKKLK